MGKNITKVGAMVRRIREQHLLSLRTMGEKIGYRPTTISNVELGHNSASPTFIKSIIDGLRLDRHEALELMDAAGFATIAGSTSKAPGVVDTSEPIGQAPASSPEPEMSYQEAVCFYALQATLSKKMDDFTAQMILKILGAL